MTDIDNWFKANLWSLNFEKTSLIQFLTKNSSHIAIRFGTDNNIKSITTNLTCLGIMTDNTLTWKSHIEMIILKLRVVCFAVTAITPFVGLITLKMVYHFYFHSVINYGIIFWRNFSYSNSSFRLQKRIIRTVRGVGIRDLCGYIFFKY